MEIHWLFVEIRTNKPIVLHSKCHVKEINRAGAVCKIPVERGGVIHESLKFVPALGVIGLTEPEADDIIDVSLVEKDLVGEEVTKSVFMGRKIESGPCRTRRGTHGSAVSLPPISIAKCKIIALHNEAKGTMKHAVIHMLEFIKVRSQVVLDDVEAFVSRDVGIH